MTVKEASHQLYEELTKNGFPGWLTCIAVREASKYFGPDDEEAIVIFLKVKRKRLLQNVESYLDNLEENGYEGYQVKIEYSGPLRLADHLTRSNNSIVDEIWEDN